MVILRLLAHSAQKPHLPHLRAVRTLIQTAWVQDDLQVDGDLEYIRKLNLVLSSSNVIPSFV
jgi:ubiquinone biosynthesis protein UbiJ